MTALTGRFDYAYFINLELKGKKNVLEWCINFKLISSGCECPNCNSPMILKETVNDIDGYVWVCQENEHFVEMSVRQGSFFEQINCDCEQSNISLITILLMTYLWIKKATSEFIQDELNLSKETVDEWIQFCREVCVEICFSKNTKLGGEGTVVEINESEFHKKKFKNNDNIVGKWVYAGFDKELDKGFLEVVEEKSESELLNVIEKYILPGTILVSECWKQYDCLDSEEFANLKKSHNVTFEDLGVGIGSTIEGMRRGIKRSLMGTPRISNKFDLYFAEYMWRRSKSDIPYDLIRSFMKEIVILFPTNI